MKTQTNIKEEILEKLDQKYADRGNYPYYAEIRDSVSQSLDRLEQSVREEDEILVKDFIHKLFGSATSRNGSVVLQSHDIQLYGNELLDKLTSQKEEEDTEIDWDNTKDGHDNGFF